MSKLTVDQIGKNGGTVIDLPTSGKWPQGNIADNAIGASQMADDAVTIAKLAATGTASATTFLRGDNSWAAAGGDNSPAFQAYVSANQTINHDTSTKIQFNTEDFDTDDAYDNSTNYRFTVPAGEAGKYFFSCHTEMGATGSTKFNYGYQYIYKNGSAVAWSAYDFRANPGEYAVFPNTLILDLVATDYMEVFAYLVMSDSSAGRTMEHARGSRFTGFKMIGI